MYNKVLFEKVCDVTCSKTELEDFCKNIDEKEFDLDDSFNKYYKVDTIIKTIELYEKGSIDDSYLAYWMNAYNWIIMASIWNKCDNTWIKSFNDFVVWKISDWLDSLSFYEDEYRKYYDLEYMKNIFRTYDMIFKTKEEWKACVSSDCNPEEEDYDAFFLAINDKEKSFIKVYCNFADLNEKAIVEEKISMEEMDGRVRELKENGYKDLSFTDEIEDLIYEELGADDMERGEDWKGYEVYEPIYNEHVTIGYPLVVLVKDKDVRLSTPEESLEYLEYKRKKKKSK